MCFHDHDGSHCWPKFISYSAETKMRFRQWCPSCPTRDPTQSKQAKVHCSKDLEALSKVEGVNLYGLVPGDWPYLAGSCKLGKWLTKWSCWYLKSMGFTACIHHYICRHKCLRLTSPQSCTKLVIVRCSKAGHIALRPQWSGSCWSHWPI